MMRVAGSNATHRAVTVRRDVVRRLILFHQQSGTPRYPSEINEAYLDTLPENGVPKDLNIVEVGSQEEIDDVVEKGPAYT